jgi:DUF4097 and DUF4098 domain-containing protein YvlB
MTPVWVKAVAIPLAVFSVLCGTLMVVAGVALIDGVNAERSYVQTAELAPGGTVSLDIPSGGIKIFTGPDGQVVVEEHDSARALTRHLAQAALDRLHTSVATTSSGVSITTVGQPLVNVNTIGDRQLTVRVPASANLSVDAASASISITGVRGDISVNAASGAITLSDLDVTGLATAHLASGSIAFDGAIHGGKVDLRAVSGRIRASIPRGTNVHYDASTVSGAVIIDRGGIPLPVLGPNGSVSSASGDLGSGGPATLTMATVSGAVYLRVR